MAKLPVIEGQQVVLTVEDLSHMGDGVGRYQGFTLFVPGGLPGEKVLATVTRLKKNYGTAQMDEIIQYAPVRTTPVCEEYNACGGCQLQHLNYREQLAWKQSFVANTLKKIGGLSVEISPILSMAEPWTYRNKVQLHVGMVHGRRRLGFYQPGSHNLVPVTNCRLLPEGFQDIISQFNEFIGTEKNIKQVWLRKSFTYQEIMAVVFVVGNNLPRNIGRVIGGMDNTSMVVMNNKRHVLKIYGNDHIKERIGQLVFLISPLSFFQINPVQTEALYKCASSFAQLTGTETLWDLYCGTGTLGLYMADKCNKLFGVEADASAVKDAKSNVALNGISNAKFYHGKVEDTLADIWESNEDNVVILDPPRKGCHEKTINALLKFLPNRIVYVSCNPATLARDLKALSPSYTVRQVQAVDMFPQTSHVETVVLMSRVEK